jgi:mevalonate pyrophosphate decarboxylase
MAGLIVLSESEKKNAETCLCKICRVGSCYLKSASACKSCLTPIVARQMCKIMCDSTK